MSRSGRQGLVLPAQDGVRRHAEEPGRLCGGEGEQVLEADDPESGLGRVVRPLSLGELVPARAVDLEGLGEAGDVQDLFLELGEAVEARSPESRYWRSRSARARPRRWVAFIRARRARVSRHRRFMAARSRRSRKGEGESTSSLGKRGLGPSREPIRGGVPRRGRRVLRLTGASKGGRWTTRPTRHGVEPAGPPGTLSALDAGRGLRHFRSLENARARGGGERMPGYRCSWCFSRSWRRRATQDSSGRSRLARKGLQLPRNPVRGDLLGRPL